MSGSKPPTTLGFALLGLLARGERSGYDLTAGLKKPIGYFWHAGHSQIYPELARLEAADLIRHTLVEQSDRPDKKVYALTPAGAAALLAWLSADTEVPRVRDELVLKAFSAARGNPASLANTMRQHAQAHTAALKEFERLQALYQQQAGESWWDPRSEWFGVQAVLRRGIGYEQEYRDWCTWMAERLEASDTESTSTGP